MNFELCETCKNYNFNLQDGILCGLSGEKPNFQDICSDYVSDPNRMKKQELIHKRKKSIKFRSESYELSDMKEALRKWGIALIVLGFIHLLISNVLSPVWGVLIVILGVLNLVILKREMFIVNGSSLLFVGLLNLINGIGFEGSVVWTFFGLLQIVWGAKEISKYQKFREIEKTNKYQDLLNKAESSDLTQITLQHSTLGIISVILFGVIVTIQIISLLMIGIHAGADPEFLTQNPGLAAVIGFTFLGGILICTIGAVLGVIDIFQKQKKKLFPVLGTVLNSLYVIFHIFTVLTSQPIN
jgi:hypothetical protein